MSLKTTTVNLMVVLEEDHQSRRNASLKMSLNLVPVHKGDVEMFIFDWISMNVDQLVSLHGKQSPSLCR